MLNEPGIRRSMASFGRWMDNVFIPHRPHSSLKDRTPDEAFWDTTPLAQAASFMHWIPAYERCQPVQRLGATSAFLDGR
jgi:hypothetical protein